MFFLLLVKDIFYNLLHYSLKKGGESCQVKEWIRIGFLHNQKIKFLVMQEPNETR